MGLFRFKQFSVNDDHAPMKVGTDAVLLGAWTRVEEAAHILDVGTGCGVVALMVAQRAPQARIDAIDNDAASCFEATYNAAQSPWADRISVHHHPIQSFSSPTGYDLIVSNPPYFSNSLLPPSPARTQARHNTTLTLPELVNACTRLLSPNGRVNLILPETSVNELVTTAEAKGLYLQAQCRIVMKAGQPAKRSLLQLVRQPVALAVTELVLLNPDSSRSDAYRELTAAYYLD